jgi:hypothetical protein
MARFAQILNHFRLNPLYVVRRIDGNGNATIHQG